MDRRNFIRTNITGIVTAGFIANWGTVSQIRNYLDQEKPLLTENNLNRFFTKSARNKELEKHIGEAIESLGRFLDNYFSASPAQQKMIENFHEEDRQQLTELLKQAAEERKIPVFRFGAGRQGEECAKTIVTLGSDKGMIRVSI